ncbi:hypothetical protein E5991_01950 [Bifidobacterium pseudolongum]|uniref:Toxin-antitoxin system protein n=1 Tax=Bifidobacterium pseudolongum TaxID=1694 RepID=A0A4V3WSA9_9BIFI|nr:hypothetical protein [Bifidobacterium pseudolongum]THG27307.1 hypothetical protein E5991_01950 [Bifidobacterium pseudolongum]
MADDGSELEDATVMAMTGTHDAPSAYAMLAGRPRLGEPYEPSAVVQFRVPASWKQLIQRDAESYGMSLSEYCRFLVESNHFKPRSKANTVKERA